MPRGTRRLHSSIGEQVTSLDSFTPAHFGLSALIHSLPLTQPIGLPVHVAASRPAPFPSMSRASPRLHSREGYGVAGV
jgi:hypothetical protein